MRYPTGHAPVDFQVGIHRVARIEEEGTQFILTVQGAQDKLVPLGRWSLDRIGRKHNGVRSCHSVKGSKKSLINLQRCQLLCRIRKPRPQETDFVYKIQFKLTNRQHLAGIILVLHPILEGLTDDELVSHRDGYPGE